MHGQWFEPVGGDDMVRQKRILAGVARPGARGEADEPDEGAGHGRERGRRRPDDRRFGRNVVRQAERGQRYVQRLRRTLGQGLAPDRKAPPFEQEFADFGGLFEAAGQNLDELAQRRRMVAAVTERIRGKGRQDLTPARGVEQGGFRRKSARPVRRAARPGFCPGSATGLPA